MIPIEIKNCLYYQHLKDGFDYCKNCIHLGNYEDYFIPKGDDDED